MQWLLLCELDLHCQVSFSGSRWVVAAMTQSPSMQHAFVEWL
jgi:hypothetical protein